jgi:hypothetical protein
MTTDSEVSVLAGKLRDLAGRLVNEWRKPDDCRVQFIRDAADRLEQQERELANLRAGIARHVTREVGIESTDPGAALAALEQLCARDNLNYRIECNRVWGPPVIVTLNRIESHDYAPYVAHVTGETFPEAVCAAILAAAENKSDAG